MRRAAVSPAPRRKAAKRAESEPSRVARELEGYVRARVPLLYLVTWEEERALREVEAVAAALDKRCVVWSETDGAIEVPPRPDKEDRRVREPAAILARILREAQQPAAPGAAAARGALYVLKDFHPYVDKPPVRRLLRDLAQALVTSGTTVILVSSQLVLPHELQKELTVIELPLPTRAELDAHLDAILGHLRAGKVRLERREREELIRSAQGMTLRELEQTLALAVVRQAGVDASVIPLVLHEKEQLVRKSTVLECVRWEQGFEAVGGLDRLKAWLGARKDAFSAEARAFGLPSPRGLCLIGVQGCGKSLSAKAVASFYRLPLLRFDVGRVFAGLVGKSEENVRTALRLAESIAPCVLWIDELEKSLSGVTSSSVSDAGTTARVISTITTWMQERPGEGVYVVATANEIAGLPPELLRKGRFDEIFFVDLPALSERQAILEIHLRARERDPVDFDLAAVATASRGFSGAELEEVVISGLYEAFAARRPLETGDLLRAAGGMVPLSETMRERIEGIRGWARGRARRASSAEPEE